MKSIDFRAIPGNTFGNCGRFGASPGGRPYKFCGGRPGGLLERFWPNCGPSARRPGAGMQQPCAGAAARDAGAAAAGRAPPPGAPAASGCAAFAGGVVRPPAARRIRARSHTDAQGGRRPATCMCAFRPLRAHACARGPPPGTGVGGAHTRLVEDPLGPARGQQKQCVRAKTAAHLVFSLSHTHTHCCVCCQRQACHVGTREERRRASRCLHARRRRNPDEESRRSPSLGCHAPRQAGPRPAEETEKEREKNPTAARQNASVFRERQVCGAAVRGPGGGKCSSKCGSKCGSRGSCEGG